MRTIGESSNARLFTVISLSWGSSNAGAHARCVREFFREMIDLSAASSTALMDVQRAWFNFGHRRRRQTDFVFYRLPVIGQLQLGMINAVNLPKHSEEIGLPANQASHNDSRALAQRGPAKVFAGEHALSLDEP